MYTLRHKQAIDRGDDQLELKQVLEALAERDKEIKNFVEKANQEIAATGKVANDTKGALELLSKSGSELNDRLLEVEQKLARGGFSEPEGEKSFGEQLTDSSDFAELVSKGRGSARFGIKAVANITSAVSGAGGAGAAIRPDRIQGIIAGPDRELVVRDLIMPGRTASNAVEFVRETGFTNSAKPVKEGDSKPQSDLSFEIDTTTVKTIAHWFRASKQVLADVPLLQSYIDGRAMYGLKYKEEEQLLAGDGSGQNLHGLIPQAVGFDHSKTKAGDTQIDILRRAALQVRLAEYRASAIILNPSDWAEIELQKDKNGKYIWVNVNEGGMSRMWRLPIIDTTAMPEGEFLVGAFNMGAQVFDREDAAVEVSTEDGDNFTKNMVTIRAEERLALAVVRPESFVHGSFVDGPASGG